MNEDGVMSDEEINSLPSYLQNDYRKMNKNIINGKNLCENCGGTGNQLFSMYQTCDDCYGRGFIDEVCKQVGGLGR